MTSGRSLSCLDFQERIMPMVRGELTGAPRDEFEAHRAACPECDQLLRTSCEDVTGFLADYIDKELPANIVRIFERHLELCPPCLHYLESYKDVIRLGRETLGDNGSKLPQMPEQLVRAILDSRDR